MQRFRRLAPLWNWLPAFRAVAETQHVRRAADLVFLSPSALSRSIHLLETELGAPLFVRSGRTLKLTVLGEELLIVVRDSMRHLDDVLVGAGSLATRPLVVAAPHALANLYLAPVLAELAWAPPGAEISGDPGDGAAELLSRGEIDLAFGWRVDLARGMACAPVGWIRRVLCCGPEHALAEVGVISPGALRSHAVAVVSGEPIPPSVPCRIALVTHDVASARAACASGRLLALLPERLAGHELTVLDFQVPPIQVFASTRQRAHDGDADPCGRLASSVIDAVRHAVARDTRDDTAGANGVASSVGRAVTTRASRPAGPPSQSSSTPGRAPG